MSASTSTFAYDQSTTPFGGVEAPVLPEKASKQPKAAKKAAGEKKTVLPALEAVPLPELTYGRFAGIGSTFPTRMKEHFNASPEKDKITAEAISALKKLGLDPTVSVIASLNGQKTAEGKTFLDAYKATEGGRAILAGLRNDEQALKRVSESVVNAYIKSVSGGELHARWEACRERKIITKEVYYLLKVLVQYIISSLFSQLVAFRATELAAAAKGARAIDITIDTIRAYLVKPSRGSFPMSCYIMGLMRSASAHFSEPERKTPAGAASPAAADADEEEVEDDGIDLLSMITEILGVVRKEMQEQWKARGVPPAQIRTSTALKKLFNHVIFQFCDKALFGIHVYESVKEGDYSDAGVGVKIDTEELTGRLYQMIFESTDSVFDAQIRANEYACLKAFIEITDRDFDNTETYRESCNILKLADKKTKLGRVEDPNAAEVTVDLITQTRKDKAAAAAEAELKAEAAKLGITFEAHVKAIAERKQKRKENIEANKLKRAAEDAERLANRAKKAVENEKKWLAFKEQHEAIVRKCSAVPLPPAESIQIGSIAATVAPTPAV